MNKIALYLLLLTVSITANALELMLDRVVINTNRGEAELNVNSRATFDFDPESGVLTSSGTWVAEDRMGPDRLYRFGHKVEDFAVGADGNHTARSYECVEGTFGPIMIANICGNYRFGPNMLDDGGLVDDIVVGEPKSLDRLEVSLFGWDGSTLTVILSPKDFSRTEVYPELSLTLTFSAGDEPPDTDAAVSPPVSPQPPAAPDPAGSP